VKILNIQHLGAIKRSIKSSTAGCKLTNNRFGVFTVSLIEENKYNNWYKKMLNYYDKNKYLNYNGTI